MKRWLVLIVLITLLLYSVADAQTVHIPDLHLLTVVERSLGKQQGQPITVADMQSLNILIANDFNIKHLNGLEHAINLTRLDVGSNKISDLTPIVNLPQLTTIFLHSNFIRDLTPLANLTQLERITLGSNQISDLTPLANLPQLKGLNLVYNRITDLSPLAGLTQLDFLQCGYNLVTNISPLAGLTNLTWLNLENNQISDITVLANLIQLEELYLQSNRIVDLTPLLPLVNLQFLELAFNPFHDNAPLCILNAENPDLTFDIQLSCAEFELSLPAGISFIHVPVKVATVDSVATTIESISDLYNALGGTDTVNFLITYNARASEWYSYFGASDTGTLADTLLADETGIVAGMKAPASISLNGTPLGQNGYSTILLQPGLNLVGLPLRDSRITRVSDLFTVSGIDNNVPVIILTADGEFKAVGRAGDPGDIPVTGGQAFILTAQRRTSVHLSGSGWK